VNLGSDSLGKSNDLGVSSVSRIHFGFGFIVNPDPDPIIEYSPLAIPAALTLSKRVFSLAGNSCNRRHTSLAPHHLYAVVFVKTNSLMNN